MKGRDERGRHRGAAGSRPVRLLPPTHCTTVAEGESRAREAPRVETLEEARPHAVALWELLAYAADAGTLPGERAAEIAAHSESCPLCCARLKGIPEIDYWLSLEDDPLAPSPGQRRVLAEVYRRGRRQFRRDRLWVLTVALPLKGLLLWWGARARARRGEALAAGAAIASVTIAALRYMLRRTP